MGEKAWSCGSVGQTKPIESTDAIGEWGSILYDINHLTILISAAFLFDSSRDFYLGWGTSLTCLWKAHPNPAKSSHFHLDTDHCIHSYTQLRHWKSGLCFPSAISRQPNGNQVRTRPGAWPFPEAHVTSSLSSLSIISCQCLWYSWFLVIHRWIMRQARDQPCSTLIACVSCRKMAKIAVIWGSSGLSFFGDCVEDGKYREGEGLSWRGWFLRECSWRLPPFPQEG